MSRERDLWQQWTGGAMSDQHQRLARGVEVQLLGRPCDEAGRVRRLVVVHHLWDDDHMTECTQIVSE
jgi:hypothetical protein